ncbi:hypothetical protein CDD81_1306 [Ophiocordyceps australis]|uniref:Aldehyde dehydrogenase domain-containing protein n=1 Tax=Ophiocordyceps australis TaxID=1399860 RepID=A0A2C5Y189_9HYPO|nr:hypothetical protein CDD81_1306 [Ophiocordyceps australis]
MPSFTVPLFIDGQEVRPRQTFDVVSPATGNVVHCCSAASVAHADAAVHAAARAFATWRKSSPVERRNVLLAAAHLLHARRDHLVQCIMDETGASAHWSHFNINFALELLKDTAGTIQTLSGSFPALTDPQTSAIVAREPYGVVLAIAPWNAPIILGTRAIVSPLAAGNTVVLKASELAPRTMWALVSVLQDAGLPKGVLNMIVHDPQSAAAVTSAVIANPNVKKINFTGSTAVGRIIGTLAGQHLKPLVLELGGKAAALVCEDANLQLAAEQCAIGALLNSGQICMSTERILVSKSIKQQFVDLLKTCVEHKFCSDPDSPVLINALAAQKTQALVADALGKGASLVLGNPDSWQPGSTKMKPFIVDEVTPDMDLYTLESFGPCVSIIPVDSEEHAVQIANESEYGLSAAVFTEDLARGMRLAREIETGAVHINSMTVHDETALPHGGVKSSGFGRFNTARGLDEWVKTKTITFQN